MALVETAFLWSVHSSCDVSPCWYNQGVILLLGTIDYNSSIISPIALFSPTCSYFLEFFVIALMELRKNYWLFIDLCLFFQGPTAYSIMDGWWFWKKYQSHVWENVWIIYEVSQL